MANQRRRGRSVVFDALPSLVMAEAEENEPLGRGAVSRTAKFSREAIREILMVLIGLVLIVWLFFGGWSTDRSTDITLGGRTVMHLNSPYLIPAHFAGSVAGARDSVVKAPGDKQGQNRAKNSPLYQVSGYDTGDTISGSDQKKTKSSAIYQYTGDVQPRLVILTVLDDTKHSRDYVEKIVENRLEYATAHRFGLLIKFASDYTQMIEVSHNSNPSWARVALSREAMISFPKAEWFWYLDESALIMDSQFDVYEKLLTPDQLDPRMLRDRPVMRYENTHIHTYRGNRAKDVSLVFCQDTKSLNTDSFFFKNSLVSKSWLEMWSQPLYRTHASIQNSEDALGHLMQWHTQYLLRASLLEARYIGSLAFPEKDNAEVAQEVGYQQGDFVVVVTCDYSTETCRREFEKLWSERVRVERAHQNKDALPQGSQDHVQQEVQVQAQEKAQEKAEKQKQQEMMI